MTNTVDFLVLKMIMFIVQQGGSSGHSDRLSLLVGGVVHY